MNEIIHGYVVSVILIKFRINANIQLWQSFSILNFEIGIVSDFLQYINPCLLESSQLLFQTGFEIWEVHVEWYHLRPCWY